MSELDTTNEASKELAKYDASKYGVQMTEQDIKIPRIKLIQKMSQKVDTGEAQVGELRDDLNNELLGNYDMPMLFLPVYLERKIIIKEKDSKGKWEFKEVVDYTGGKVQFYNEDQTIKRTMVWDTYVLRPEDIAEGSPVPYRVGFQGASADGGRTLVSHMNKLVAKGIPPFAYLLELTAKSVTNDKGTFGVMGMRVSTDENGKPVEATPEQMSACDQWFDMIMTGQKSNTEEDFIEV